MTQAQNVLLRCLIVWVPALGLLAWRFWRKSPGVGLTLGYCFQMWLYYWLGALIYVLPWSDLLQEHLVALGFVQSTYGIVAFTAGVLVGGKLLSKFAFGRDNRLSSPNQGLPKVYLATGIVMYVALGTVLGRLPTLNAVIA